MPALLIEQHNAIGYVPLTLRSCTS